MKTIGFPISTKENEKRRALLPEDMHSLSHVNALYFEKGYGHVLFIPDEAYTSLGAHMVSREEVLQKDIICEPKIGDADFLPQLRDQTIFGWVHALQNKQTAQMLVDQGLTAYAWEDMHKNGRHTYWRNNELAGEAGILDAFNHHATIPYEAKVAVLGRGNVAMGVLKILMRLGAEVTVYSRKRLKLFRHEMHRYDVIVNALLWDTKREDHVIYHKDLPKLKPGAMLVDISCDRAGAIETTCPTTIEDPVYKVNNVLHYAVDHTPTLFHQTSTRSISKATAPYIDALIMQTPDKTLKDALICKNGVMLHPEILAAISS